MEALFLEENVALIGVTWDIRDLQGRRAPERGRTPWKSILRIKRAPNALISKIPETIRKVRMI